MENEMNFEKMTRLKYCQIGNYAISLYLDDTMGMYVCTNTLVLDENNIGKSMAEIMAMDNNSSLHDGDFVSSDYDEAIMEMQLRLLDCLNDYFDDDDEVVVVN